jgi:hypothetical protein
MQSVHQVSGSMKTGRACLSQQRAGRSIASTNNTIRILRKNVTVRAEGEGASQAKTAETKSSVSGSSLLGGTPRTGSSLLGGTPTPTAKKSSTPSPSAGSQGSTSGSSLLGAAPPAGLSSSSRPPSQSASKMDIKDVELKSGVGVDYASLRDLLAEEKWREAEDETRAKLIEAAGQGAKDRNWVYWSEIKSIPVEDMETLDALWAAASNGKFGYRVQRQMWIQNRKQWIRFFRAIDWVQGENDIYRKWPQEFKYETSAPKGHLPLTNALRGTRLFEAILEHPAFDTKKQTKN